MYKDLYDMTLEELHNTLVQRKQGIGYEIWKNASLNMFVLGADKFPQTPEEASPELYPPKKTYKMPEFLKNSKHKKIVD